jgi:hypothetical protein
MALSRDHARIALATIRLVNGALALLAPEVMLRRFEAGQEASPGAGPDTGRVAVYPLRMFGIRTVVLGIQLLADGSVRQSGSPRQSGSLRQQGKVGVVIHAADAASAITAGLRRQLPARVAVVAAGISVTNTALAWILATGGEGTDVAGGHGTDVAGGHGTDVAGGHGTDIAAGGRRTDSEDRISGGAGPPAARAQRGR